LHDAAGNLDKAFVKNDECRGVVGSANRVKAIRERFSFLKDEVLSTHELGSFVVRKEMQAHPAVPEFMYNSAES
jgi:hypothetical protein